MFAFLRRRFRPRTEDLLREQDEIISQLEECDYCHRREVSWLINKSRMQKISLDDHMEMSVYLMCFSCSVQQLCKDLHKMNRKISFERSKFCQLKNAMDSLPLKSLVKGHDWEAYIRAQGMVSSLMTLWGHYYTLFAELKKLIELSETLTKQLAMVHRTFSPDLSNVWKFHVLDKETGPKFAQLAAAFGRHKDSCYRIITEQLQDESIALCQELEKGGEAQKIIRRFRGEIPADVNSNEESDLNIFPATGLFLGNTSTVTWAKVLQMSTKVDGVKSDDIGGTPNGDPQPAEKDKSEATGEVKKTLKLKMADEVDEGYEPSQQYELSPESLKTLEYFTGVRPIPVEY